MSRSFQLITILVALELINSIVLCKRTKVQDSNEEDFEHEYLSRLFRAISRAKEVRSFNSRKNYRNADQYQYLYKILSRQQEAEGHNEESPFQNARDELAGLAEKELLNALVKKSSAVVEKPYVQKKGGNDFLVIRSDTSDPFVTVVPNDIYYNVEKKCVNWLDDCNQKGLRHRLLQRIQGPYK